MAKAKAKKVDQPEQKPGYKTTEFWLTFALELGQGVAVVMGKPSLPGVATVAYNLSRGLAKSGLIRGWLGSELTKD